MYNCYTAAPHQMRVLWKGSGKTIGVFCLIVFSALLLGLYVLYMSLATQRGFALRDLEDTVHNLRNQQELLEAKVAERERLIRVQSRVQALGFVAPQQIHFLHQPTNVAIR